MDSASSAGKTAILLIGFQNDYFAEDGALHAVIEENASEHDVLANTLQLLEQAETQDWLAIQLPILFSSDYSELERPVGLMAKIRELGAFQRGTPGGAVVPEMMQLGDRVEHLEGKTGFNAFLGTGLEDHLHKAGVERVVLCGVVTSVCIDSTGRAAAELGFDVTILTDCTAGRNETEHAFYSESIYPLYATVATSGELLASTTGRQAA